MTHPVRKAQIENKYGRLITLYRAEFDSWDAARALDGPGHKEAASRYEGSHIDEWSGCTIEQVRDYARRGWEAGVAEIDGRLPVLGEGEVPSWEYGLAEEGSEVDVASWLAGEPACMGDMRTVPLSRPLVRIAVDLSTNCNVESNRMLRVGRSVLMCVERLRAAGFPTVVDATFTAYGVLPKKVNNKPLADHSVKFTGIVHVQEAGVPIHGALLAFWVAHPGALRRAMFALAETLPWETRVACGFRSSWAYGFPISGTYNPSPLREEYDEWAPSAEESDDVIDAWVSDVMDRRLG